MSAGPSGRRLAQVLSSFSVGLLEVSRHGGNFCGDAADNPCFSIITLAMGLVSIYNWVE
jgi:hypothetical protein